MEKKIINIPWQRKEIKCILCAIDTTNKDYYKEMVESHYKIKEEISFITIDIKGRYRTVLGKYNEVYWSIPIGNYLKIFISKEILKETPKDRGTHKKTIFYRYEGIFDYKRNLTSSRYTRNIIIQRNYSSEYKYSILPACKICPENKLSKKECRRIQLRAYCGKDLFCDKQNIIFEQYKKKLIKVFHKYILPEITKILKNNRLERR